MDHCSSATIAISLSSAALTHIEYMEIGFARFVDNRNIDIILIRLFKRDIYSYIHVYNGDVDCEFYF